jgi:hypothetical protein
VFHGEQRVWDWYGYYGSSDSNHWNWAGQTYTGLAGDGAYRIVVTPDDEFWMYAQTAY